MGEVRKNFTRISKKDFLALFKTIWSRFGRDNNLSGSILYTGKDNPKTQYYPTVPAEDVMGPNLKQAMLAEPKVNSYWKEEGKGEVFNGRKLYDYFLESEKTKDEGELSIRSDYLQVYCLYVGCADLQEVIVKYVQKRTVFTGVHYSVKYRDVRTFEMSVDLSETPYKATMKGYWSLFPDRVYYGEGHFVENKGLFFSLTDRKTGYFYLILDIKSLEGMKEPFVIGRALTSSSWDYPISSEIFLVNKEISQTPAKMLKLKRYFHLKRSTHRTRNPEYSGDLDKLAIRKVKPKDFKIQTGCYRTWVYNSKGMVLQQKFRVEEDYSAYLDRKTRDPEGLDTLFCFLALNQQPSKRILLTLYPKDSFSLIGYTILHNFRPDREYIYGAYINVGDDLRPPAHHAVVLRYEADPDVFQPEVFDTQSEAFKSVLQDPNLSKMKQCLDLLEVNDYAGVAKMFGP